MEKSLFGFRVIEVPGLKNFAMMSPPPKLGEAFTITFADGRIVKARVADVEVSENQFPPSVTVKFDYLYDSQS